MSSANNLVTIGFDILWIFHFLQVAYGIMAFDFHSVKARVEPPKSFEPQCCFKDCKQEGKREIGEGIPYNRTIILECGWFP
jgi:hypothetical protein